MGRQAVELRDQGALAVVCVVGFHGARWGKPPPCSPQEPSHAHTLASPSLVCPVTQHLQTYLSRTGQCPLAEGGPRGPHPHLPRWGQNRRSLQGSGSGRTGNLAVSWTPLGGAQRGWGDCGTGAWGEGQEWEGGGPLTVPAPGLSWGRMGWSPSPSFPRAMGQRPGGWAGRQAEAPGPWGSWYLHFPASGPPGQLWCPEWQEGPGRR